MENTKTRSFRNIFSLAISTVVLIIAGAVIVSYTGIQFYRIYTDYQLKKEAIQYAVDSGSYLRAEFDDNSGIGFNVNKGSVPGILETKQGNTLFIEVKPRNSDDEYYRTPGGVIITPHFQDVEVL